MTVSAQDLIYMRSQPQRQNWYLAIDKPDTIWTAQVNGSPSRGATTIPFDNEVETVTPEYHFTLWVGTSVGQDDVAVLRFKSKSGSNIEVASNDVTWADDQYLTIKREVRPWAVLPSIDGVYEDEDKTYSDENENQHPLARIGPPAAGWLNSDGELDISFYSDDVAIASGASLSSYSWAFQNGTPSTSSSAGTEESPITVTYSATGRHWVSHEVTDSNGKTHKRYTQVHTFDSNSPPITAFEVGSLTADRESGGWRATFTVRQDADEDDFQDMAQVVLFTDGASWDGTETDIDYEWGYRGNIAFVGFIVGDSVYKDPNTSWVTFEAISIVEVMKEITVWGASLVDHGTSAWHVIPDMTLNLEAFHVITEHSTIDHVCDVYLNLDVIDMVYTDLTEGKLYDHLKVGIGEAGRALLLNNKLGQIYLEPNVQLMLASDRASIEHMFTLSHGDWRDEISLGKEKPTKNACQVDFIGFYYSGNDPKSLGSLAPGRQHSTGSVQKVTGVRTNTQTLANQYSSVFERNFNNEFTDIAIPLSGWWPVIDIAPQKFIQLTLAENDTYRSLVWDEQNVIPQSLSITINNEKGYALTDITAEKEIENESTGLSNEIPELDPPDTPPPLPRWDDEYDEYDSVIASCSNGTTNQMILSFTIREDWPIWYNILATYLEDVESGNLDPEYSQDMGAGVLMSAVAMGNVAYATFNSQWSGGSGPLPKNSPYTGLWYCPDITRNDAVFENWQLLVSERDAYNATGYSVTHRFGALDITDGGVVCALVHKAGGLSPAGDDFVAYIGSGDSLTPVPLGEYVYQDAPLGKRYFEADYTRSLYCVRASSNGVFYIGGMLMVGYTNRKPILIAGGSGGFSKVTYDPTASNTSYFSVGAGYMSTHEGVVTKLRGPAWDTGVYDDTYASRFLLSSAGGNVLYKGGAGIVESRELIASEDGIAGGGGSGFGRNAVLNWPDGGVCTYLNAQELVWVPLGMAEKLYSPIVVYGERTGSSWQFCSKTTNAYDVLEDNWVGNWVGGSQDQNSNIRAFFSPSAMPTT